MLVFRKIWPCFVFLKHPFWDSPFCLIVYKCFQKFNLEVLFCWHTQQILNKKELSKIKTCIFNSWKIFLLIFGIVFSQIKWSITSTILNTARISICTRITSSSTSRGAFHSIKPSYHNNIFSASFNCFNLTKPSTLLKVTLLNGCFLNCKNGIKSRNAS